MKQIVIIHGTARKNNRSRHVASWMLERLEQHPKLEVTLVNPAAAGIKLTDESNGDNYPELKKILAQADGYIIVTPEYNHSYPGSLKILLDLFYDEYAHKPVGLVGVSTGDFGGARALTALLPVVKKLGMLPTRTDIMVTRVEDSFANGKPLDPQVWNPRADKMITELLQLGEALER